jgi:2-methylfumaryl-CoA hydratase
VRTIATSNRPCPEFPAREGGGYAAGVILDFDYWALAPR